MLETRSLGGIGKLYCDNRLLGEVYYNVKQDRSHHLIYGSIVFVGSDMELSNDDKLYRLLLEGECHLIVRLHKDPEARYSPYSWISCDGIMHPSEASHSSA